MDKREQRIEQALKILLETGDIKAVAKQFGVCEKTVKRWQKQGNKSVHNEKISTARAEADDFDGRASEIVDKSLLLIKKRIDAALCFEDELLVLLQIIADEEELPQKEKSALISKLKNLEIQKIGEVIATVNSFCTHTDKERGNDDFKLEIKVDE